MPETVVKKLIAKQKRNLYINIPKLKTHSMSGVTLGCKNQWAFPQHSDRRADHNFNLHSKLIDVLKYVSPDFTIIDGIEGTTHGHYPPTSLAKDLVKPFRILIGGKDVISTDIVGARIFGLDLNEIPHLKIATERGLGAGIQSINDIEIIGNLSRFKTKYSYDIVEKFPPDLNIISGKERWCKEGCRNNPLSLIQVLYLDYGGKGGFDFVAGKGHNIEVIDKLKGPVFIAGDCAIEEVGNRLIERLGRKNVFLSHTCNNLSESASALFHLMKVNALNLVPLNPFKSIKLFLQAKLHGSTSKSPNLLSKWFKVV